MIPSSVVTAYITAWRAAADGHVAELKAWGKRGRTGPKPQWRERDYIAAGLEAAVEEMVKMGIVRRV